MEPSFRTALERWLLGIWFARRPAGLAGRLLRLPALLTRWYSSRQRKTIREVSSRVDRSRRAGFRRPWVIVVGNLIAGGAGKTPVVLALAQALADRGFSVGLVSHAYRAGLRGAHRVDAASDAAQVGDEAVLLALQSGLPCASGRDREAALQSLLDATPGLQVVITDDGLQHVGLARDYELVVFDDRGLGNGRLLPAGPLREPIEHVSTMDAVLFNAPAPPSLTHPRQHRFTLAPRALVTLETFFAQAPRATTADSPGTSPSSSLEPSSTASLEASVAAIRSQPGLRLIALAGIGNPQRFAQTLDSLGLHCPLIPLGDHEALDAARLAALEADLILMTAKDAVKLRGVNDPRCRVLLVGAELDPRLVEWLAGSLRERELAAASR